jgi:uncharacterized protein YndB with AHSA1/START domain
MAHLRIVAERGIPLIETAREFDAPREVLFRAHTEPNLLERWFGPRRLTTVVECLENRDGGRWRFVQRDAEGHEYAFHGVMHGTPSLDRIVRTFEFEGAPGHVSLEALTFQDLGNGRTLLRTVTAFQSVEARDGMIASGMESGVSDSMERLEELVAELLPVS